MPVNLPTFVDRQYDAEKHSEARAGGQIIRGAANYFIDGYGLRMLDEWTERYRADRVADYRAAEIGAAEMWWPIMVAYRAATAVPSPEPAVPGYRAGDTTAVPGLPCRAAVPGRGDQRWFDGDLPLLMSFVSSLGKKDQRRLARAIEIEYKDLGYESPNPLSLIQVLRNENIIEFVGEWLDQNDFI